MARKKKNYRQRNRNDRSDRPASQDKAEQSKEFSSDDREFGKGKGSNDISWYTRNPNLATAAAMIPYPYRPGMTMNLAGNVPYTIPGVLAMSWVPSVGFSASATDPISIAAKEIYSKVRSKYSGSLEADPPDFIMYLMALDSIYAYIAWMKRIYRTLNAYTPDNYQTPDALLMAMGIPQASIPTLRAEKTKLWQAVNTLVLSSRKLTCPALMDVMNRHYWMSDNVYLDANTLNAQFYVFTPKALFTFAEVPVFGDTAGNTASGLKYVTLASPNIMSFTADGLLSFGERLIQALVAWDDAYTISGYLMRAYEGTPAFIVEEIPMDEKLTPLYSEEVLMQIENSRVVINGNDLDIESYVVNQDPLTNTVKSTNTFEYNTWVPGSSGGDVGYNYEMGNHVLTMRSDSPTVADNIIATRLHPTNVITTPAQKAAKAAASINSGTEIPLFWRLVSVSQSGEVLDTTFDGVIIILQNADNTANPGIGVYARFVAALSQFDWSPIIPMAYKYPGDENVRYTLFGDVHNVTLVDKQVLNNINRICLFSEFNSFDF